MKKIQIPYLYFEIDGSSKICIGEKDKKKRVCRFCGKSMPDVKFHSIGHALSESIGNTNIIDLEECDDCNEKFSSIEADFYNLHALFLSYNNICGKKSSLSKPRKIKEKSGDLEIYNEQKADNIWWTWKKGERYEDCQKREIEVNHRLLLTHTFNSLQFTPHNIYKCLCKYCIGVIPNTLLCNFNQTIAWINGDNEIDVLPKVIAYVIPPISHPKIKVLIRNNNNTNSPYAVGCLEFADRGYCFIIPLANEETIPSLDSLQLKNLDEIFNALRPNKTNVFCGYIDLSDKERKRPNISLEINNVHVGKTCMIDQREVNEST